MITLYDFELSGNCYKVRLLLNLLDLPFQKKTVDLAGGEHRTQAFLSLNPFGQIPVLVDGSTVLRDSQAILVYLASRYGGQDWWPQEPAQLGRIMAWLSTAANEIAHGPSILRVHKKFGRDIDIEAAKTITASTLKIIDAYLKENTWLVGDAISIADIAIYPYLALSPEGDVDLQPYPNVLRWFGDIRKLDRYVGMPGMWSL